MGRNLIVVRAFSTFNVGDIIAQDDPLYTDNAAVLIRQGMCEWEKLPEEKVGAGNLAYKIPAATSDNLVTPPEP